MMDIFAIFLEDKSYPLSVIQKEIRLRAQKRKIPQGIAVGIMGDHGASWSAVRAIVTTANTLAFAWGVPAFAVQYNADQNTVKEIFQTVLKNSRVSAIYNGEPNITTPKNVISYNKKR